MAITNLRVVTGYYDGLGTPAIETIVSAQLAAGWIPNGAPVLTDVYGQVVQTMVKSDNLLTTAYTVVTGAVPMAPDNSWFTLGNPLWIDSGRYLQAYTKGDQVLSKVELDTQVSGVLKVANGGTGATNANDAWLNIRPTANTPLAADPVNPLDATTKRYVDATTTTAGNNVRELWRRNLVEVGLTLVTGSFENGGTLSSANQALWSNTEGQCYTWAGSFPKVVPAGSTPASTGGVSPSTWVNVSNASLRSSLASTSGAGYIGTVTAEGNLGKLLSADDMAIKYGYITESVSGRLAKHGVKVVLVGDSLSTPFVTEANNIAASFDSFLRRNVLAFNNSAQFYNRAIGGARYNELGKGTSNMPAPNSNYPWYSDISRRWMDYIVDLKPDVIFIAFGMNDGNGWASGAFPQPVFYSMVDELRSISSNPEIVFCTNTLPSTVNPTTASEDQQRGRDAMAGWTRSFAGKAGYSVMDFHRRFKCLRDGVDPCIASYARKTLNRSVTLPYTHPADCEVYSAAITLTDPSTATTNMVFNLSAYTNNILTLRYDTATGMWRTTVYTATTSTVGISESEFSPGPAPVAGTVIYFTINGDVVSITIGLNTKPIFSKPVIRFGGKFSPTIQGSGTVTLNFNEGTLVPVKSELTDHDIYNTDGDGGNGLNHPTAKTIARIYGRVVDDWFNLLVNTVPECKHVVDVNFARGTVIVDNPYCPDLNAEIKIGSALTFANGSLSYSRDVDGKAIGAIFGATNRAYIDQSLFNYMGSYKKLTIEVEFVAPNAQAYVVKLGESLATDGVTVQVTDTLEPRATTSSSGGVSDLYGSTSFPYTAGRTYKLIYTIDCVSGVARLFAPDTTMRGNIATTGIADLPSTALSKIKFGYAADNAYGTDVVVKSMRLSFSN